MAMRICPQCGTETQALLCRVDGFSTVDAARHLGPDHGSREGDTLAGRYRLDQMIGRTSLGSVYRATDLRLPTPLAVRVLAPVFASDIGLIARFQRDGRLVASLAHPNIVHVMEHGVAEDGTLFIAEELVAGPTLAEVLTRSGPLDPARVVAFGREIFDALSEAHAHGVLHRSLGLENVVLVTRSGGGESLKIGDFGLVHVLADDAAQPFVFPQVLSAAWRTMAPEQARGRGISGHADLYSAGAILYELLTGRPAFAPTSPSDLLVAHSVKLPPPPECDGRMLSGPLVELIMRCLEKKPWNRPDGAQRALELLELCRAQPILPLPTPTADFAAPPASARVNKRGTNPYGVPTEPRGAPRPAKLTRLRATPPPDVLSVPARSNRIVPVALAEDARGKSAARAETSGRGFAGRADLDPSGDMMLEPVPRPRSPLLWFLAGVLVAGAVAAVVIALTRERTGGEAIEVPVAHADVARGPSEDAAAEIMDRGALGADPAPARLSQATTSAVDVLSPLMDASAAEVSARPADGEPVRAAVPEAKVNGRRDKPAQKDLDPLADLEDPEVVIKAPVATLHRVLLDSDPVAARIEVAGRLVGETPMYVEWTGDGGVDVVVSKVGYRAVRQRLAPTTGQTLRLELTPVN